MRELSNNEMAIVSLATAAVTLTLGGWLVAGSWTDFGISALTGLLWLVTLCAVNGNDVNVTRVMIMFPIGHAALYGIYAYMNNIDFIKPSVILIIVDTVVLAVTTIIFSLCMSAIKR